MERDGNLQYYSRLLQWMDPGYYLVDSASGAMQRVVSREENGQSHRFGKLYQVVQVFGSEEGKTSSIAFDQLLEQVLQGKVEVVDGEEGRELLAHKKTESIVAGQHIVTVKSGTRRVVRSISGRTFVLEVDAGPQEGDQKAYDTLHVTRGLMQGIITAE